MEVVDLDKTNPSLAMSQTGLLPQGAMRRHHSHARIPGLERLRNLSKINRFCRLRLVWLLTPHFRYFRIPIDKSSLKYRWACTDSSVLGRGANSTTPICHLLALNLILPEVIES